MGEVPRRALSMAKSSSDSPGGLGRANRTDQGHI